MQFQPGHGCYGPSNMLNATESFAFEYQHPCEPYPIALADAMPPFDQRYRGRVMNKINYLAHMAAWGTEFRVHADLFMVHLPHAFTNFKAVIMEPEHIDHPNFALIPFMLTRLHFEDMQARAPLVALACETSVGPCCCCCCKCCCCCYCS